MIKLINDKQSESNKIENYNFKVLEMLSKYLNNASDFIKKELVEEIANECKVSSEYTFTVLLAAACGLNIEDSIEDKELFQLYFQPMAHQLNPSEYCKNAYYKDIVIPDKSIGRIELRNISYKPYEAFVYNDLVKMPDGRIIPQIGFFNTQFSYPALYENGRVWMTITPNELETMKEPIHNASGNVLTYGLGLGYYTYMVSEKNEVATVTVIEQNEDVIRTFETYILPQFKHKDKIRIIKEDAFKYSREQMATECYDFVFTDLWHDVSDGIDMYLKMKDYEKLSPNTKFSYWIEKSILCYL